MASLNKSQDSADRRGNVGKGDFQSAASIKGVRSNLSLWGKSKCCGAGVIRLQGDKSKTVCEKCGKQL